MSKIYIQLVICFLTLGLFSNSFAQTTSIPDTVLLTYIASKFPQTLDSNKHLILSEAAKITDPFTCRNKGLKNAEGVQYFVNVPTLDISFNQLNFVTDISGLKNLQVLDISDNAILQVGSFSTLTKLNNVDFKNNKLSKLPDLSKNIQLEILSAPGNLLDTLPDFSTLTKLKQLYVNNNKLKKMPPLDKNTALTILRCGNNQLVDFPVIGKLTNLTDVEAENNLLPVFPDLPVPDKIQVLNLQNNVLTRLPDLSKSDSLKTAMLYGNKLTFEDFQTAVSLKNYATIFQLNPQQTLHIAAPITVVESQKLMLQTKTDTTVSGTTYEWFKNGISQKKTNTDAFVITNASLIDEGYYYAQLSNSLFPGVKLETDSFQVTVISCINVSGFSTKVSGKDCDQSGKIEVVPSGQPTTVVSYSLAGLFTGKKYASSNGVFENLGEPSYVLSVTAGNACTKEIGKIDIPFQKCEYPYITPNGDGVDDTYFFNGKGKAVITDKFGNKIQSFSLPYEWNGSQSSGLVSPGLYVVNINEGQEVIKITVVY